MNVLSTGVLSFFFSWVFTSFMLAGCVHAIPVGTNQGGVALAGSSLVELEYIVRGVVREASVTGNVIPSVKISAYRGERLISEVLSDNEGRFVVYTTMSGRRINESRAKNANKSSFHWDTDPTRVAHAYPGTNKYSRWTMTLVLKAEGYDDQTISIGVPCRVDSPRHIILMVSKGEKEDSHYPTHKLLNLALKYQ